YVVPPSIDDDPRLAETGIDDAAQEPVRLGDAGDRTQPHAIEIDAVDPHRIDLDRPQGVDAALDAERILADGIGAGLDEELRRLDRLDRYLLGERLRRRRRRLGDGGRGDGGCSGSGWRQRR